MEVSLVSRMCCVELIIAHLRGVGGYCPPCPPPPKNTWCTNFRVKFTNTVDIGLTMSIKDPSPHFSGPSVYVVLPTYLLSSKGLSMS